MEISLKALIFAPAYDTDGKHDAQGAFIPESKAFASLHGLDSPILFDNNQPLVIRKKRVLERIIKEKPNSVSTLALVCHGWRDGVQLGFHSGETRELATALKQVCTKDLTVILYCCDTGRDGDADSADDIQPGPGGGGGFADALRCALDWAGFHAVVYAHASTGDTVRNPYVRAFRTGETGGAPFLIEPGSTLWGQWRKSLQDGTLRYRFPFMTREAVVAELAATKAGVA